MNKLLLSIVVSSTLAACAIGPDYQRPALDLPENKSAPAASPSTTAWWKIYNDPVLEQLMSEALTRNLDLAAAAARVAEAEALLGVTASDQIPTAYLAANRNRNRSSEKSANFQPGFPLNTSSTSVSLNVSYEIDIWGKYRRATEAARADLLAVEANRDALRLSLTAQLAQTYFASRALDQQAIAARTVAQQGSYALTLQKLRFDAGLISEFDYQQRNAEVNAVQALLPPLESQRDQMQRALGIILGRSPREVLEYKLPTAAMPPTSSVPLMANLPSNLILQRPDIRAAEQQLIAANARIGVARAAYFPSISLTGLLGGESRSLSDLFTGPARTWHYAADLLSPIIASRRLTGQVNAAEARNQQALAQYQLTIANAFREVQDAINAQASARSVAEIEQRRAEALAKSWQLAILRYENGIASQLDVIDAERSRLQSQINQVDAERQYRASIADLYKALGSAVVAPN